MLPCVWPRTVTIWPPQAVSAPSSTRRSTPSTTRRFKSQQPNETTSIAATLVLGRGLVPFMLVLVGDALRSWSSMTWFKARFNWPSQGRLSCVG
jgi:hypothetical protein